MNGKQKEVQKAFLDREKECLDELKDIYQNALDDIDDKLALLLGRNDADLQNVIYQIEYQKQLKGQVETILEQLHSDEFDTVSEFLEQSYIDGFTGALYDISGQGISMVMPIDQNQMVKAIKNETKLNEDLYTRLGKDTKKLSKQIASEISRGIASTKTFREIARNISNLANIPRNNASRIARTEGHRIQISAAMDVQRRAKDMGCDIVKQWDSTMDRHTRKSHMKVDGELKEVDEPFSNGLMFPGDPDGSASEVINCRCALLQRAKWALDEEELKKLQEKADYYGLNKTDSFEDYKSKYLKAANTETRHQEENNNIPQTKIKTNAKNTVKKDNIAEKENIDIENKNNNQKRKQIETGFDGKIPNDKLEEYNQKAYNQIKLDTGYSEEKAKEFHDSLKQYFGGDYETILSGETDTAKIIKEGIEKMPSYDGSIYRGMTFISEDAKKFTSLKAGDSISPKGIISSWSSDERVAVSFGGAQDYERSSVILECVDNQSGVGVQHISKFGKKEAEVLSSANYEVVEVVTQNKYDYLSEHKELLYFPEDLEEEAKNLKGNVVCKIKVKEIN